MARTPLIRELSLDFKARSGYINSSNEKLIIAEEAIKEEKEGNGGDKVKEEKEVNEPRLNSGSPA